MQTTLGNRVQTSGFSCRATSRVTWSTLICQSTTSSGGRRRHGSLTWVRRWSPVTPQVRRLRLQPIGHNSQSLILDSDWLTGIFVYCQFSHCLGLDFLLRDCTNIVNFFSNKTKYFRLRQNDEVLLLSFFDCSLSILWVLWVLSEVILNASWSHTEVSSRKWWKLVMKSSWMHPEVVLKLVLGNDEN